MVQISTSTTGDTISERVQTYVQIKRLWDDPWEMADYLVPIQAVHAAAPAMSHAGFRYHYGTIKREDETAFGTALPMTLRDHYVRVMAIYPDEDEADMLWVGIITREGFRMFGEASGVATGEQGVQAWGLEHILDRCFIHSAIVNEATPREIGHAPSFNRHEGRTGHQYVGNRSPNTTTGGLYVFADAATGSMWTNRQIVEYLLRYYGPDLTLPHSPSFVLAGQYEALDEMTAVVQPHGRSLFHILNQLIDRRRGLGWVLRSSGSGAGEVYVYSVLDHDVSVGATVLPANKEQVAIDADEEIDSDFHVVIDTQTQVDRVIVRGERIKSCFTMSETDGTLEQAWTAALEAEYIAAPGDTAEQRDNARSSDRYARVFTTYRLPAAWDWMAGSGTPIPAGPNWFADKQIVNPACLDDGTIDTTTQAPYWLADKTLLRLLPVYEDPNVPAGAVTERRKPIAFVYTIYMVGNEVKSRWLDASRLSQHHGRNATLQMTDAEPAAIVRFHPNHYIATGLATVPAATTEVRTLFTWSGGNLLITVGIECDHHLEVRAETGAGVLGVRPFDPPRTKVIDVPGAEAWYVVRGTVLDVTDEGKPRHDPGGLVRHDVDKLLAVAALAKGWYGRERNAAHMEVHNIGRYLSPGKMMTGITTGLSRQVVNTVVTSQAWQFEAGITTVETGYWDLDFAGAAAALDPDARIIVQEMLIRVGKLEQRVANLPDRIGGGGGNAIWMEFEE